MIDNSTSVILSELATELATELDLHYEQDEFHRLSESISTLRKTAEMLSMSGHGVPDVVTHVLRRYAQATN